MLKVRVIPTLLWKHYGLVKGKCFDSWRRVGPVLPAVKVYNHRDVDELIIVDVIAHESNNAPDYESIREFSNECFVPLTIGGGIRTVEHAKQILRNGADKICINTAAYESPNLIDEIARVFGSQSVVASIDVRGNSEYGWTCFSHAGTKTTGREVKSWVKELENRGAGEILLTSIDRDGTMRGYDLPLIENVVKITSVPIIASGGAGDYSHLIEATKAGAAAVAAASIFHFTAKTPAEAKQKMRDAGIPVRTVFTN